MALLNRMWAAPNIVCVCVDRNINGEIGGRMYHKYDSGSIMFQNVGQLMKQMDQLYEKINFPQSSVRERSFEEYQPGGRHTKIHSVLDGKDLDDKKGELMTLLIYVRYRQKATWQGWLYYREKDKMIVFDSELELIKGIDEIVSR